MRAKTRFALRNGVNLQPFAAFNVLHRSKSFGMEMDGEKQTLAGRTALEGRFGIEAGWKAICPHASDTAKGRTATKKPHCRSNGCFDAPGNVLTHRRHTCTAPCAAPQTDPNPAAPKGGA
ncbi:autotransporter outer membrane beta-barrel domain-containing protein [Neisseria gonorrhoeae]